MTGADNALQEPSVYSADLTRALGMGVRTAKTARCQYGFVSAGDVVVLQDLSVVLCKAPIQRDGDAEVRIIAQCAECRRSPPSKRRYALPSLSLSSRVPKIKMMRIIETRR